MPAEWLHILDAAEKLATILGILVAGIWAYYQFFRGRVFRPRLEVAISGQRSANRQNNLLLIRARVKNVGLSKVDIQQRGTAIRLLEMKENNQVAGKTRAVEWKHAATFSVFENHAWIEPGESIEDQSIVDLPTSTSETLRLELRIVSQGISWKTWALTAPGFGQPNPVTEDTTHVPD